ncbi:hypothetical protein Tco_1529030 [Tanacetum coccineum]
MTTTAGRHPTTIPRTAVTTATSDVTTATPRHCRLVLLESSAAALISFQIVSAGAIDKYIFVSLEYELPPPDPPIPMPESVYPLSESAVVTRIIFYDKKMFAYFLIVKINVDSIIKSI